MSHGQPARLQFLVVHPSCWLSILGIQCTKVTFGYRFMVARRTTASVFLVVRRRNWLSRAHQQPKFRTLIPDIILILLDQVTYVICVLKNGYTILAIWHFTSSLVVMSHKINACSLYAPWRISALRVLAWLHTCAIS